MDTINCIITRRSIRKYQDRKIPQEQVQTLLRAAMNAPSACNQKPWHFVIIEDKEVLKGISEIHSGFHHLKEAPMTLLICGEPQATTLEFYWRYDCAAATQNILLAAHAGGLGAVWLGIHPDGGEDSEIIARLLNLPQHIKPFSLISLGYPAEIALSQDKFDSFRIHANSKW